MKQQANTTDIKMKINYNPGGGEKKSVQQDVEVVKAFHQRQRTGEMLTTPASVSLPSC